LHFKPEIIYLAVCFLISELTGLTILLTSAYRERLLCKNFNFPLLKGILSLSMPFFITGIFGDIYNSIDSSMLTILTGAKEAGYYGAAFRLIGVCLVFVPIIDSATMPTLSKSFKESIPQYTLLLRNIMDFLLLVSFPLALAIVLFGQEATLILYGPGFEKSYRIMVFLAPILLVIYLNVFLAVGLRLSTTGYKMALVLCFTTLVNVVVKRFMIPFGAEQWGEGGAGMAAAISTFGAEMLICSLFLMITPHRSFDWKSAKNCILSIAPVLIAAVFHEPIAATPVYLKIIGFVLGTPLYALAIGLLSIKNIKQILQLRNSQESP
jgi:O-antigen/teichoic acid export membrane protein